MIRQHFTFSKKKYIAFHNGQLLPDVTLERIIDAALRGKMTPSGENVLARADTRIRAVS